MFHMSILNLTALFKIDENRVQAVWNWPNPSTGKQVAELSGVIGIVYYKCSV